MGIDLTKNIKLEPIWQRRYLIARFLVWTLLIFVVVYLGGVIFFPSQTFSIQFLGPNFKIKRINNINFSDNPLSFEAFSKENFSGAKINISLAKKDTELINQEIKVRKSYKAFAYPISEHPIGFQSGELSKSEDDYYIVSDNKLRHFISWQVAQSLGYNKESFIQVAPEELDYNEKGADVTDTKSYPNDALFNIDGKYYQLKDKSLHPFISEKAFKSFFETRHAIKKNADFLSLYPVSQDIIGFSDGTLLSFDISVFIVSNGKVMPFNNPTTFLSFGYVWDDVVPVSEEDIGLYSRDKLFTIDSPHPDGTVFKTIENNNYYLVENGKKWPIQGKNILKSYLKKSPILTNEESLNFYNFCKLKLAIWPLNTISCSASVKNIAKYIGNDYQFKTALPSKNNIKSINIKFTRDINWLNMRDTLSDIKRRFLINYGYENQQ